MKKTCFVIMPFGADSTESKKRFDGVYKGIIVPAVREAGYEPVREDITGTPGSIPKSIIQKLATSEMVVADLSGMNPNVFYELGIRHVFSKCGTVLLIHKSEKIPFDNATHRVVLYTNELDDLESTHKQIVDAIQKRELESADTDNLIHDTYPALPDDLLKSLNRNALSTENEKLKARINTLSLENEKQKKLLESSGLLEGRKNISSRSISELFATARDALTKSGRTVIIKLSQLAATANIDEFVNYLEEVLEAGYVSEDDYIQIYMLCDKLGLLPLQVAIMEHAYSLFPSSEEIVIFLSDAYSEMPLGETKLRAVSLLEDMLTIKFAENKCSIADPSLLTDKKIATLFNTYTRLDFYERTLAFCEQYESIGLPQSALILRNKADALDELHNYEGAEKAYKELLDFDYYDDTNHAFYASFLSGQRKFSDAYKEREIALALDPNDASRYLNFAIEIWNHHYVRESDDVIVLQTNRDRINNAVLPFLYSALKIGTEDLKQRVLELLYRQNLKEIAEKIILGEEIGEEGLDKFPINYVLKMKVK